MVKFFLLLGAKIALLAESFYTIGAFCKDNFGIKKRLYRLRNRFTRLAGQKADNWQLRHMDKVLNLPFRDDIAKPNRDNAIDVYIGDTPEDVIGDDVWAETFTEQPAPLTAEEKKEYLSHVTGVCLGSDAFFPFGDNIERARRSGVTAIVQPGGSIRDQQVIDTCNKYGIAMAFCGIRLFHH